jgi:hypothetical protein
MSVSQGSAWNSGKKLERGRASNDLATMNCRNFYSADTRFGETPAAGNTIADTQGSPLQYEQEVYQFASSSDAAAFFHGSYSAFGRCRSASSTTGTVSVRIATRSLTGGHAAGGRHLPFAYPGAAICEESRWLTRTTCTASR